MRGVFAIGIMAAAILVAPTVSAFCRTTTVVQKENYDSATMGCWDKDPVAHGIPLFWRNSCVGYSIERSASKKISYDDAANLISQAFTRWTGTTCPTDGSGKSRVSIDVRDLGPSDCTTVQYVSGAANQNVIIFRDESWPYDHSVLGLTKVVYSPTTGEIFGADMELNMVDMTPLAIRDPVVGNAYDFLSVVTHETGHFLGLAHSDHTEATMYASYVAPDTHARVLSTDDINGICTVYKPNGDRAVFTGKVTAAPQCDPTPRGGYTTECLERSGCSPAPVGPISPAPGVLVGLALVGRRLRRRDSAWQRHAG